MLKAIKEIIGKKTTKQEREQEVLIGLLEYYIKTGKPVGSNTLREEGFESLSSATIRNYFVELEKQGFLHQQHASGGRTPTEAAFRWYAGKVSGSKEIELYQSKELESLRVNEDREIASYLQSAAGVFSSLTNCAVFLSAPRFDHDYLVEIKLIPIDSKRCLCILITDFGVIQSEVMNVDKKLSTFSAKRIEEYFHWRLTGLDKPEGLDIEDEKLAQNLYNELIMRYIVNYSTFTDEDIYRTGFSRLLAYPEFHDATVLANSLVLFENIHSIRLLLKECSKVKGVKCWIGTDFTTLGGQKPECTIIAKPYCINNQTVGAVGIMGPIRMPYKNMFGLIETFSNNISEALTRNVYKHKISFRQPGNDTSLLTQAELKLLEDKTK